MRTNITGQLIRTRRKELRLTQDGLQSKILSKGYSIGDKTISLWERTEDNTLHSLKYTVLCESLEIDKDTQKPLSIFESTELKSAFCNLKKFPKDIQEMAFAIIQNLNEDSVKRIHSLLP